MAIDTRQMEALAKRLEQITRQADVKFQEIGKKLGQGYIRTAKQETPVKTGNLRRSWDIDDITQKGHLTEVTIVNPVEYAEYVDKGHRVGESGWVDGRYMTDKAEEAVERNAEKWGRPIINQWLGGLGT